MIRKEDIEKILKKINSDYFSIVFTNNSGVEKQFIKKNIDEPILSTSFTNEINNIFPKYKCFSEFVILNNFSVDFKDINITKKDKEILRNGKWELDSLISNGITYELFEFKYYKYTLSDLLRLIIIMLKINEINSIYILYYKKLKLSEESNVNIDFVELNITDNVFDETLKFLNDEIDDFDIQNTLKNKLNNKIQSNKKLNWVCIKVIKDTSNTNNLFQEISNKENFKKIETFTKLTTKKVSLIQNKITLDNIETLFLENDFESFKGDNSKDSKNWVSLFRNNVLVNFFRNKSNDLPFNLALAEWFVNFVEYDIYQNPNCKKISNIDEIFSIKNLVLNNDYEEIGKRIFEHHYRWSNLLHTNKEIKQQNTSLNIDDNTTITIQQNKTTKVIKQVVFEFIKRNNLNTNDEFEELFKQSSIDIKKITKNYENLNELATKSIFILYFFAKLNIYNNKLLDKLEGKEKIDQSLSFLSLIKNKKEIKIINYPFYFNLVIKNKTKNIYESLIVDALVCEEITND